MTDKEAKKRVHKAMLMIGRALDLSVPVGNGAWDKYAKKLLHYWGANDIDYVSLLKHERDILGYCKEELVDYINYLHGD